LTYGEYMEKQALLVMDLQTSIVARYGEDGQALLATVNEATSAARAHGVLVIYVRVGFRDGAPEVSPRNVNFTNAAKEGTKNDSNPVSQIHSAIAPKDGDVVVTKRRVSAFSGSDLDMILRSQGITSLTLMGIATRGVVLSTVRQAADLDYELTVLRDGCVDLDPETHRVLLDKVFPRQASVISTTDWIASLET
jgi:nicotinamidase-related amidase